MLDLSPIANAIKSVQAPPPQAQPSVVQEMKSIPQAEIDHAVPPLPAKGGEPGLGEHFDLYDTEANRGLPPQKDGKPESPPTAHAAAQATHAGALQNASPKQAPPAELTPDQPKADASKKAKPRSKYKLLGNKTGLPQPTTDPPHLDLPFLKPLGGKSLGSAIDARI